MRSDRPYYESPTGVEDPPETPGYKCRVSDVGVRQPPPRAAKSVIVIDFFQKDNGKPGTGEPSGERGVDSGLQEMFSDDDIVESGGEGWRRKGKRKSPDT